MYLLSYRNLPPLFVYLNLMRMSWAQLSRTFVSQSKFSILSNMSTGTKLSPTSSLRCRSRSCSRASSDDSFNTAVNQVSQGYVSTPGYGLSFHPRGERGHEDRSRKISRDSGFSGTPMGDISDWSNNSSIRYTCHKFVKMKWILRGFSWMLTKFDDFLSIPVNLKGRPRNWLKDRQPWTICKNNGARRRSPCTVQVPWRSPCSLTGQLKCYLSTWSS